MIIKNGIHIQDRVNPEGLCASLRARDTRLGPRRACYTYTYYTLHSTSAMRYADARASAPTPILILILTTSNSTTTITLTLTITTPHNTNSTYTSIPQPTQPAQPDCQSRHSQS